MATSSIFANFDITDPEKAEAFVRALERSEEDERRHPKKKHTNCEYVTDPDRIQEIFDGWKRNHDGKGHN